MTDETIAYSRETWQRMYESLDADERLLWNRYVAPKVEPSSTQYITGLVAQHDGDALRHYDPWHAILHAVQLMVRATKWWHELTETERQHVRDEHEQATERMRALLEPRMREIEEGRTITDPETGIAFTHSAIQDLADLNGHEDDANA